MCWRAGVLACWGVGMGCCFVWIIYIANSPNETICGQYLFQSEFDGCMVAYGVVHLPIKDTVMSKANSRQIDSTLT